MIFVKKFASGAIAALVIAAIFCGSAFAAAARNTQPADWPAIYAKRLEHDLNGYFPPPLQPYRVKVFVDHDRDGHPVGPIYFRSLSRDLTCGVPQAEIEKELEAERTQHGWGLPMFAVPLPANEISAKQWEIEESNVEYRMGLFLTQLEAETVRNPIARAVEDAAIKKLYAITGSDQSNGTETKTFLNEYWAPFPIFGLSCGEGRSINISVDFAAIHMLDWRSGASVDEATAAFTAIGHYYLLHLNLDGFVAERSAAYDKELAAFKKELRSSRSLFSDAEAAAYTKLVDKMEAANRSFASEKYADADRVVAGIMEEAKAATPVTGSESKERLAVEDHFMQLADNLRMLKDQTFSLILSFSVSVPTSNVTDFDIDKASRDIAQKIDAAMHKFNGTKHEATEAYDV